MKIKIIKKNSETNAENQVYFQKSQSRENNKNVVQYKSIDNFDKTVKVEKVEQKVTQNILGWISELRERKEIDMVNAQNLLSSFR